MQLQNQNIRTNKINIIIMTFVFELLITLTHAMANNLFSKSDQSINAATKYALKPNSSLTKDCEKGYINACVSLAKNSKTYQDRIIAILKRACQKEYQSCLILAEIYNTKSQIPQNLNIIDINSKNIKNDNFAEDFIGFIAKVKNLGIPTNPQEALKYQELAIPLMENACYSRTNQDLQACLVLSNFYENAIAVSLNRPKANRLVEFVLDSFMKKCVLNDRQSCVALSQYPDYLTMINSEIPTIEHECNDKDSTACFQVSLYYTQDFYIPVKNAESNYSSKPKMDFVKSAYFLQKGCLLESRLCENSIFEIPYAKACIMDNDMKACANVKSNKPEFLSLSCNDGNMSSCYELRYLPEFEDQKRFIALAQRACKGGIIEACGELARIYKAGDKVSQSDDKAFNLTQRACNWELKQGIKTHNNYCYDTAYAYEAMDIAKQDINKAIKLYSYSCSFNPNACARLARLYEVYKKRNQTALELYKHACDSGSNEVKSCIKVANNYFLEATNGRNSINNIISAISYNQKANEIGGNYMAESLYHLGLIYAIENFTDYNDDSKTETIQPNPYTNYALAAKYFEESCTKGLFESCELYEQYGAKMQGELYRLCKSRKDGKNMNTCYQLVLYDIIPSSKTNKNHNATAIMDNLLSFCAKDFMPACGFVVRLSNEQEYEKYLSSKNIVENFQLQDKLCTISKDNTYDIITLNNDKGIFCANAANYAYDNKDYLRFIHTLEKYEYDFIAHTLPVQDALDKLALSYFETQQYENMITLYRYIYENKIPNSYYFLALAYQQGLGVPKNSNKAIEIYELGINKEENSNQDSESREFALSYFGLSQSYNMGLGVPKDSYKSMELLRLSCPLDKKLDSYNTVAKACAMLGRESTKYGDLEKANEYYQRACDARYEGDIILCKNTNKAK